MSVTLEQMMNGLTPEHDFGLSQMSGQSELGITKIAGVTALNTFRAGNPDLLGLDLNQGGVRFTWYGMTAYGMMERSSHTSLTSIG